MEENEKLEELLPGTDPESQLKAERDELYVTFDGQAGYQLEAGDEVRIRCAERRVRLLRPSSRSYFDVLRQKLKWNER